jgi:hypothetical protein
LSGPRSWDPRQRDDGDHGARRHHGQERPGADLRVAQVLDVRERREQLLARPEEQGPPGACRLGQRPLVLQLGLPEPLGKLRFRVDEGPVGDAPAVGVCHGERAVPGSDAGGADLDDDLFHLVHRVRVRERLAQGQQEPAAPVGPDGGLLDATCAFALGAQPELGGARGGEVRERVAVVLGPLAGLVHHGAERADRPSAQVEDGIAGERDQAHLPDQVVVAQQGVLAGVGRHHRLAAGGDHVRERAGVLQQPVRLHGLRHPRRAREHLPLADHEVDDGGGHPQVAPNQASEPVKSLVRGGRTETDVLKVSQRLEVRRHLLSIAREGRVRDRCTGCVPFAPGG